MSYVTVEVDIDHGKIIAREPEKLAFVGKGVLTAPTAGPKADQPLPPYVPLFKGTGKPVTLPSREELDAIIWGD